MELSKILLIVGIIVLLFFLIRYIVRVNSNTISSLNDATSSVIIPYTSLTTDSSGSSATNFTYALWIYVSDWSYRYGQNKVVLTRSGSGSTTTTYNGTYMNSSVPSCGNTPFPADGAGSDLNGCAIHTAQYLYNVASKFSGGSYTKNGCENTPNGCCPFSIIPKIDPTGTNCSMSGGALDPAPTMYLGATENNLFYQLAVPDPVLNTKQIIYTLGVANIPIQRWVHTILCVYDRTAEIYIDGKLARIGVMPNVLSSISTTGDVYLSPAEPGAASGSEVGFSGYTSNLVYYPNPITPQDAWNLYRKGPGTSVMSGSSGGGGDYSVQVSLYDGNIEKNSFTIGGSDSTTTTTTTS
jgi:hypothetical protein